MKSLIVLFTLFLSSQAVAQGRAADLRGTHEVSTSWPASCASRMRADAWDASVESVTSICNKQNALVAAQNGKSCGRGMCMDAIRHPSGGLTVPIQVSASIAPLENEVRVSLSFELPSASNPSSSEWVLACKPAYDFMKNRDFYSPIVASFDRMLAALPACTR